MTSKAGSSSGYVIGSKSMYNVFQPIREGNPCDFPALTTRYLVGALHSTNHSGLNFRGFPVGNETAPIVRDFPKRVQPCKVH